jgi:predicted transcriptional regulator
MDRIDITTALFTQCPAEHFAKRRNVQPEFWNDMWRRYIELKYTRKDLQEWYMFKTKKQISKKTIGRYIVRQEIYEDAQIAVKSGAKIVSREYFINHGNRNMEVIDLVDREDYLL